MLKALISIFVLLILDIKTEVKSQDRVLSKNSIENVRITSIAVFDEGTYSEDSAGSPQVDIVRDTCLGDPADLSDDTPEPFYDTFAGVEILNDTNVNITFSKIWFKFPRVDGTKRSFVSRRLAPATIGEIKAGQRTKLFSFFLMASDGGKVITGRGSDTTLSAGFRGVTFYLRGRASNGKLYQIKAKTTISFNNYDRCASS